MLPPPSFFVAALVLAVTPGPGIAYVVARTADGGRAEGLASCIGTGLGGLVQVGAAAAGLSLLLVRSAAAFSIVQYVGAAYLVYLGVRRLMAGSSTAPGAVRLGGARRALLDGILVEALNVKTALFFLAFLPQFVAVRSAPWLQLVGMGTVCVALNALVEVTAVFGAARLLGTGPAAQRRSVLLDKLSGVAFVGLGLSAAVARRGALL